MILFLTDGESDAGAIQTKMAELMALAGKDKTGKCNLVIAAIGFAEGKSVLQTYAPNGYYAESIEQLPEIFKTFLKNILEDV